MGALRPATVNQGPTSKKKLGPGLYSTQAAKLNCSIEGKVEEF